EPALDLQMLAQSFDVIDEMPGRVVGEARMGAALSAAALIEQHYSIDPWIEEGTHLPVCAASRAAVEEDGRFAGRITALLVIDLVQIRHAQKARSQRTHRGIQAPSVHRILSICRARSSRHPAHRPSNPGGSFGSASATCR